jgi:hypothetical protein
MMIEDRNSAYETRIGTSANQVNLKFEEALPEIKKGLCKCIAEVYLKSSE